MKKTNLLKTFLKVCLFYLIGFVWYFGGIIAAALFFGGIKGPGRFHELEFLVYIVFAPLFPFSPLTTLIRETFGLNSPISTTLTTVIPISILATSAYLIWKLYQFVIKRVIKKARKATS